MVFSSANWTNICHDITSRMRFSAEFGSTEEHDTSELKLFRFF